MKIVSESVCYWVRSLISDTVSNIFYDIKTLFFLICHFVKGCNECEVSFAKYRVFKHGRIAAKNARAY